MTKLILMSWWPLMMMMICCCDLFGVIVVTAFQHQTRVGQPSSRISPTTLHPPRIKYHCYDDSLRTCLFLGNSKTAPSVSSSSSSFGLSSSNDKWNAKYQELAKFYKTHGHFKVENPGSLYRWMSNQRRKRKVVGRYAPLTDEQILLLDQIDFPWNPKKGRPGGSDDEQGWNSRYQELVEFYNKHGHLRVEYQGSLYTWMSFQRRKRKEEGDNNKKYAPLNDEQIQLLDEIGFEWNPEVGHPKGLNHKGWITKYRELAEFYKIHGHLRVEFRGSLYQWMVVQRRKRKGVKRYAPLTDEQIQLLDEINFPWN